jgi:hypothetical protein
MSRKNTTTYNIHYGNAYKSTIYSEKPEVGAVKKKILSPVIDR